MGRSLAVIGVLLAALTGVSSASAQPSSWVRPPTESDTSHAAQWVTFSADNGEAWAQYMLGTMYEFGRGMERDDARAFTWYEKAADQGDASAQFRAGLMLHEGRGTSRDDVRALDRLTRAEAGGNAEAANLLGVLYAFGSNAAPVDEARAVTLWKKAAKAGVPDAQFNLAAAFANGRGVDTDPGQAARWYVKAAYAYLDIGYRPGAERAVSALEQSRPDHPALPSLTAILAKGGPGAIPPGGPAAPEPEAAPLPAAPEAVPEPTPAPGLEAAPVPQAAPPPPEPPKKKHGFLFWRR